MFRVLFFAALVLCFGALSSVRAQGTIGASCTGCTAAASRSTALSGDNNDISGGAGNSVVLGGSSQTIDFGNGIIGAGSLNSLSGSGGESSGIFAGEGNSINSPDAGFRLNGASILGGRRNTIHGGSPDNSVVTGEENRISMLQTLQGGRCVILSGYNNSMGFAASSVIMGGDGNKIEGNATSSGLTTENSYIGTGRLNTLEGRNSAILGAGQFNEVSADFAQVLGSFGKATHASSIVISSKNTQSNTVSSIDDVGLHCESKGDNSVHICTDGNSFFVNGINLLEELNATKEALANIKDECKIQSTTDSRLLQSAVNDCIPQAEGGVDLLVVILAGVFGAIAALAVVGLFAVSRLKYQ